MRNLIEAWVPRVLVVVSFSGAALVALSGAGPVTLSGGELFSALGLAFTAAAILWRGGRLEGALNRVEADIRGLSKGLNDMSDFKAASAADRAALGERVSEIERRLAGIDATCSQMHKWQQGGHSS